MLPKVSVGMVEGDWLPVGIMRRPPVNNYHRCWVYHVKAGVIAANGDDPGWSIGAFTHWLPTSLRHSGFVNWQFLDDCKPSPPTTTIES